MVPTFRKLKHNSDPQRLIQFEQSESITNFQTHLLLDGRSLKLQQFHSILTKDVPTIESTQKKVQPFQKCLPTDGIRVFISPVGNIVEN